MSLMKLKSGTDIRGTAIGESAELSQRAVEQIAAGFVRFLCEKTALAPEAMEICIGNDSRISATDIKKALVRVLCAKGVKVFDCGLCSTPAMFMVTVETDCTASIQITASHHPYDKNGLKFFTREGGFEAEDITKILEYAQEVTCEFPNEGRAEFFDFMPRYAEILREKIKKECNAPDYSLPLKGFKLVTDAGNGVGGFFALNVLKPLGADITGSLFLEPDGRFPNHIPNPENETAMSFICKAVTENNADLGIIFDTDVDRAACVASNGQEINRNALVALSSVIALADNPGGTVVTDSVTSDGLKKFINETLGGSHYRYKRGYKNVINKAIELNALGINCPLAIETSGHAALRENYFLDDGAYLMTKIIILLARLRSEGKTLEELLSALEQPLEAIEKRYIIALEDFRAYGEGIISDLEEYARGFDCITPAQDNREGCRLSFDKEHGDGWGLLRLSVHDPVLPLNIESNSEGGTEKIKKFFADFLSGYDKLSEK